MIKNNNKGTQILILNDFFEYCHGIADALGREEIHERALQASKCLDAFLEEQDEK